MSNRPDIPPFRHKAANSSSMSGIGWLLSIIVAAAVAAFALGFFG